MRFLRARAIRGLETVEPDRYCRAFDFEGDPGVVTVSNVPERCLLSAAVHCGNVRALSSIARNIQRVFDTQTDIHVVSEHLAHDPQLAALLQQRPGLRTPGGWDGFELAVRAILGQQITIEGARNLACRMVARFGRPLPDSVRARTGLTQVFPTPETLANVDIASLGMPKARAAALQSLAAAVVADRGLFDRAQSLEVTIERLRSLPGIGEWTAQYVALRAIRETDAFPHSDIGLLRGSANGGARPTPAALLARAERWRPWRAYAAQHLWAKDELHERQKTNNLPRHSGDAARIAQHRQQ